MSSWELLGEYSKKLDRHNCFQFLEIGRILLGGPDVDYFEDIKIDLNIDSDDDGSLDLDNESDEDDFDSCAFMKLFLDRIDHKLKDEDFRSIDALLHITIAVGYRDPIEIILKNGPNINSINPFYHGYSPLHVAAEQNLPRTAKDHLLVHGADVNMKSSDGSTPLHVVASNIYFPSIFGIDERPNHMLMLQFLLEYGANAEEEDDSGFRPIHRAASLTPEYVKYLIDRGVNINVKDKEGWTPLHYADGEHCEAIIELLLDHGASIDIENEYSPFEFNRCGIETDDEFCYTKEAMIHARLIIKNDIAGIPVNKENLQRIRNDFKKYWPRDIGLISEKYNHNLATYEEELRKEVAIMKKRKIYESRSLHDVFIDKYPKYVSNEKLVDNLNEVNFRKFPEYGKLLERKIDLDQKRYKLVTSVFETLMRFRNPFGDRSKQLLTDELIEEILYTLDIWSLNEIIRLETSPSYALMEDHIKSKCHNEETWWRYTCGYDCILEKLEGRNFYETRYQLRIAHKIGDGSFMKLFLNRLDRGLEHENFGSKDALLYLAATFGDLDLTKLLLANGANVNSKNCYKNNRSSLQVAVENNDFKIVKLLLDQGANVNMEDCYGNTPLHEIGHCARRSDTEVLEILLDHGVIVEKSNNNGHRPIHSAVYGSLGCVKRLIEYDVDINVTHHGGLTPLACAARLWNNRRYDGKAIIEFLLDEGATIAPGSNCSPFLLAQRDCVRISVDLRREFEYTDIARLLGELILKNSAAGLPVNEKELQQLRTDVRTNRPRDIKLISKRYKHNLTTYEKQLKKEVAIMKRKNIFDSMSLYDIFVDESPKYRSDAAVIASLNSLDYKEFPEYEDLLRRKIILDTRRYELVASVFDLLMRNRNPSDDKSRQTLSDDMIEKVLYKLDIWDLRKIIHCDTNPKKKKFKLS